MRHTTLPIPEIGLIAATRGMLGAGIALLLAAALPQCAHVGPAPGRFAFAVMGDVPYTAAPARAR